MTTFNMFSKTNFWQECQEQVVRIKHDERDNRKTLSEGWDD